MLRIEQAVLVLFCVLSICFLVCDNLLLFTLATLVILSFIILLLFSTHNYKSGFQYNHLSAESEGLNTDMFHRDSKLYRHSVRNSKTPTPSSPLSAPGPAQNAQRKAPAVGSYRTTAASQITAASTSRNSYLLAPSFASGHVITESDQFKFTPCDKRAKDRLYSHYSAQPQEKFLPSVRRLPSNAVDYSPSYKPPTTPSRSLGSRILSTIRSPQKIFQKVGAFPHVSLTPPPSKSVLSENSSSSKRLATVRIALPDTSYNRSLESQISVESDLSGAQFVSTFPAPKSKRKRGVVEETPVDENDSKRRRQYYDEDIEMSTEEEYRSFNVRKRPAISQSREESILAMERDHKRVRHEDHSESDDVGFDGNHEMCRNEEDEAVDINDEINTTSHDMSEDFTIDRNIQADHSENIGDRNAIEASFTSSRRLIKKQFAELSRENSALSSNDSIASNQNTETQHHTDDRDTEQSDNNSSAHQETEQAHNVEEEQQETEEHSTSDTVPDTTDKTQPKYTKEKIIALKNTDMKRRHTQLSVSHKMKTTVIPNLQYKLEMEDFVSDRETEKTRVSTMLHKENTQQPSEGLSSEGSEKPAQELFSTASAISKPSSTTTAAVFTTSASALSSLPMVSVSAAPNKATTPSAVTPTTLLTTSASNKPSLVTSVFASSTGTINQSSTTLPNFNFSSKPATSTLPPGTTNAGANGLITASGMTSSAPTSTVSASTAVTSTSPAAASNVESPAPNFNFGPTKQPGFSGLPSASEKQSLQNYSSVSSTTAPSTMFSGLAANVVSSSTSAFASTSDASLQKIEKSSAVVVPSVLSTSTAGASVPTFAFPQASSIATRQPPSFAEATSKPSNSLSIFGQTTTTSSTFSFGQISTSTAATSASSVFGKLSAKPFDSTPVFGKTIVSSTNVTAPTFGSSAQSTTAQTLGNAVTPSTSSVTAVTETEKSTKSTTAQPIFGQSATSSSIFGQPARSLAPVFGQQAATSSSAPVFGQVTSSSASMFGQTTASQKSEQSSSTGSIFGQTTASQKSDQPSSTGSIFGQTTASQKSEQPSSTGSIFGQTTSTTTSKSSMPSIFSASVGSSQTSTFGTTSVPKTTSTAQTFNFTGTVSSASSTAPTFGSAASSFGSTFGASATQGTLGGNNAAAPAAQGFNFGSASTPASGSGFNFGAAAPQFSSGQTDESSSSSNMFSAGSSSTAARPRATAVRTARRRTTKR